MFNFVGIKFSWVSIQGNLWSFICLRYTCSTWFLDIRISIVLYGIVMWNTYLYAPAVCSLIASFWQYAKFYLSTDEADFLLQIWCNTIYVVWLFGRGNFGKFLLVCFSYLCHVKIWMAKFGKPPVIHLIRQGFPPPNLRAMWYSILSL